jgi:hypothetical protein
MSTRKIGDVSAAARGSAQVQRAAETMGVRAKLAWNFFRA